MSNRLEELAQAVQSELKANNYNQPEKTEISNEEAQVESPVEETREISEAERQARSLGWKSREEREAEGKSNDFFVDADEYVRRQPLFERIDRQNKELQQLKDFVKQAASSIESIKSETREATIRELDAKRISAVQIGDVEAFNNYDKEIKKLQTSSPVIEQQQPVHVPHEAQDFVSRNAGWYNEHSVENKKMMLFAQTVDQHLAKEAALEGRQLNPQEHFKAIEAEIKKRFPHRFENPKTSQPSTVGKSTVTQNVATKAPSALVARMTPQQREFADYFIKHSKGAYTLEQYAKDLDKKGILGK